MTEEPKTEQQSEEKPENAKSKHRSPNYPYIGLPDALDRAKQLQVVGRTHFVPITAVRNTWQYKMGTGNQVVAALKAYGLIDVQGEGEKRQVRVSDLGAKILDDHSQKDELLKEAALKPELHRELWDKYNGDLPDNTVIREYLRWERHFNPANVDKFIDQFKDTIAYVNLSTSDKISKDTEDKGGIGMKTEHVSKQPNNSSFQGAFDGFFGAKQDSDKPLVKPLFEYSVPLSIQREVNAMLRIDGQQLKKRDLQLLAKKVKDLIDAFEEEEEENVIRLKAVWHNDDFDIPVVVISKPEKAPDGREYVSIEGSESKIPYEQVEIEDE